ncbi:hypothetical protein [uncultured Muriicola sp.]|uniref:hypothetical protein n=1 Tax=uncultured Muriicola sp. TaxID=1583102 RepID=UPI0026111BF0|nr:hypothetical protein [uncultured Muriicola sp.]
MISEDPIFEPITAQAVIHDKKKLSEGFRYTLKYVGHAMAERVASSSITSEGGELYIADMVNVYAAAQTVEDGSIVYIHQVVGLTNGNKKILFDGSRDDPNFEDTTTTFESSIALIGVEARLNMYDDCGVDPMD